MEDPNVNANPNPDLDLNPNPNPREVRDYHRGSGTLRGGGVQKVHDSGPSMKAYRGKLDHRLAYCVVACLATTVTILIIFGLFHQGTHEELSDYISNLRSKIIEAIPPVTTTLTPPRVTTELIEVAVPFDENATTIEVVTTTTTPEPSTTEALTCIGTVDVDPNRCLTIHELQEDWNVLHRSYITLWEMVALDIIICVLLLPLACLFNNEFFKGRTFKLFFRAAVIVTLFYLFAQCLYLIRPLLTSAMYYPTIVTKLFVTKQPRDMEAIQQIESRYACQFETSTELVNLQLQQPCMPRIMDTLLPPYAIVLLIFIDLIPILFAVFTYAWDAWIKDSFLCLKVRRRIELNNQRRPQSREDILKRAMAEPRYM